MKGCGRVNIPELLAPAGNMEKAKIAIAYGADALYLAGNQFGMRAMAGNFDLEELKTVVHYAHDRAVKIYVTVNVFPHNRDLPGIPDYIQYLGEIGVDAIILADVGIMRIAQQVAPHVPLHLSTQANTTNWQAAKFWAELGIARIVTAREITKDDMAIMRTKVSAEMEVFVHGAMCMAYSGRCMLSHVMTGRDANRGACAQSCRWKYAVVEETRPNKYYPIEEAPEGTYIFNSSDLCLLEYLPDLIAIGIDSLKIEGRMKSAYYVATIVRAYRQALDSYQSDPNNYTLDPVLLKEVSKVSHRPYYPGFFTGNQAGTNPESTAYSQTYDFLGVVQEYDEASGEAIIEVRNRLQIGDALEIMQPRAENFDFVVEHIIDDKTNKSVDAVHANYQARIPMPKVLPFSILRKVKVKIEI